MFSSGSPAKSWLKPVFLALFSFFITIDRVELKNASGEWVTVIRPDRRVDLTQQEAVVRFFNNGRIPAGRYTNVRVSLTEEEGTKKKRIFERSSDYSPSVLIQKGAFVGVSFSFSFGVDAQKPFSAETVKEVRLVVDQDERIDGSDKIKTWS